MFLFELSYWIEISAQLQVIVRNTQFGMLLRDSLRRSVGEVDGINNLLTL